MVNTFLIMFLSVGWHRGTVVSAASWKQKGSQPQHMQVMLIGGLKDARRYEHEHKDVSATNLFKAYPTFSPTLWLCLVRDIWQWLRAERDSE